MLTEKERDVEIWKDIENYEQLYQVSNLGRVKSLERVVKRSDGSILPIKEKIRKPGINGWGYPIVQLHKEGKNKTFKIHRLVACTFISNPENKPQINHINGVKTDNRVSNLEWNTRSENMRHAHDTGLKEGSKGSKHGRSKLSEQDIPIIREMLKEGISQRKIAKRFNISQAKISNIKLGKTWKHV